MKLHYSQTIINISSNLLQFYYLMKLHYSQTILSTFSSTLQFYYLMKLHYSQTPILIPHQGSKVLLPYEITLFSNKQVSNQNRFLVLLPYEITLFSNCVAVFFCSAWFYYLMKLHYSQTINI